MAEINDEYERIWGTEEERTTFEEEQYEQYIQSQTTDPHDEQELALRTSEVKLNQIDNDLGAFERELFIRNNSDKINKNFLSKVVGDKLDRAMSGMATVFLTNFIRCRTSFRMLFRLSLTMSLLGCDDLRQELTVKVRLPR
ncbi:hypothetical protein [Enterococcus casseliflavus]|uniref:hypothetical protein n=2 Tax=Enterococcus casseliflavus TaxID=37734 RepID=UPI0022E0850F|nr:hypothetical protein [Enterococcus casseliflavus]